MKAITRARWILVYLLAVAFPIRGQASITKEQAADFVRNTWGIVDLSSDVLSETLDTSYSGIPYTDWIDFLVNAPDFLQPLANGDYSDAASKAFAYAKSATLIKAISLAGLTGITAPARLAVWPIEHVLNDFNKAVNDAAYRHQCSLYFLARSEKNSYQEIVDSQVGQLLPHSVIFKVDQGWLAQSLNYTPSFPNFGTAPNFFDYAEKLWQAKQAYASGFASARTQLANEFRSAATPPTPVKPSIITSPRSRSARIGTTVTFSVLAAGTAPLSYQWQRNGTDISGATGTSYTTPTLQPGNSGDQYRIRVTNAQGNANSAAATLTVDPSAPVIITSVSPSELLGLPSPQTQRLKVYGSGFTSGSTLVFKHGTSTFNSDASRLTFANANELDYDIIVDGGTGDWTVQILNGGDHSNLGYFLVSKPSIGSTGSLLVNLLPGGAISAGAQWRVDGGSYRNDGDTAIGLAPGSHPVSFKPVPGYVPPPDQAVTVVANLQTPVNATYTPVALSTYRLTLNSTAGQGSVTPRPFGNEGNNYTAGAVVQLTADANFGYHFVGWSGDASGTANPIGIVMDGNKSVTANFAPGDPRLGTLVVTIKPPEAVAAGVKWGTYYDNYRNSGTSWTTDPGNFHIVLHPVDGWLGIPLKSVTVTAGQTNYVTVTFAQDPTPGILVVTLTPPNVVSAGAKWRLNGGGPRSSGESVPLPPGSGYNITFDSPPGWTAPASQTVQIQRSQTKTVSGNYTPPVGQPVIGGVSPPIGPMTGGTTLTINGVNFVSPATVIIGGQPATNVMVLSATKITCLTPFNSIYGTAPVIVQTPGGSATNLNGFAYGLQRGNGMELVTAVGGRAHAVAVQGNYAYLGEGSSLVVLDISNAASPSPVGRLAMPGIVRDLKLLGQYAYVANADGGLQVVDVSNPTAPQLRGFHETPGPNWAEGIAILGGKAYVADGAGLEIFDLGNPTVPTRISSTNLGGYAWDVAVQTTANGVFAYVTANNRLNIVDVTQPRSPILRGSLAAGSSPVSVAVAGNYAFVGNIDGVKMANVANPDVPVDLGQSGGLVFSVAAANGLLYGAGPSAFSVYSYGSGGLSLLGSSTTIPADGYNLWVSGTRAYIAGGSEGFRIVDVANSANPSSIATFLDSGLIGSYDCVTLSGNYLYAGTSSGFKVFDVSNQGQPNQVGQYAGVSTSQGQVLVKDGIAYVRGNGGSGITILNVSTPSSPSLLTTIPISVVSPVRMALSGNLLCIVGGNASSQPRFVTVDVSNPSLPVVRGVLDFPSVDGYAVSVAVNGSKAVVGISGNPNQLKVLDISNVDSLVEQGTLALANIDYPSDIQLSADGRYAFVGGWRNNILQVIDVENAANPSQIANVSLPARAWDLNLQGNVVYVAAQYPGGYILAFDVSNPALPVLKRSYPTPAPAFGIAISTGLIGQQDVMYVADSVGGLVVLRNKDLEAPQVYITDPTFAATYTNTKGTLNLGGGSTDNKGVTRVTWSNDRGGGGEAFGTESWFISGITLQPSLNILTVTAFDQAGNSSSDTLTVDYQVPKQGQTILFPAIRDRYIYGDLTFKLSAAASSGLAVNFSVVSGPASISSDGVLTITGAGGVTVQAAQEGNETFNAAPPSVVSFTVAKADQNISFAPVPDRTLGDATFPVSATTSSGLPVTFKVLPGPAMLDAANVVTLTGAGTVVVRASQAGNANFNAAADVERSFTVAKPPQFIIFGPLSRQIVGDAPFPLAATASSGLLVQFEILAGPAILSGNVVILTGPGLVIVRASQPGDETYNAAPTVVQTLIVSPGNNVIGDAQRLANGAFSFRFYGEPGQTEVIENSTDLKLWNPISTNKVSALGYFEFTQPSDGSILHGFFRVRLP